MFLTEIAIQKQILLIAGRPLMCLQMECDANLRRAKQVFMARCEEYDKARTAANRAEEEGGSSATKTVDKKKRLEEEARNKVVQFP